MALSIEPLAWDIAIVDGRGLPTPTFQRLWQTLQAQAGGGSVAPGYYVRAGLRHGWSAPTGTASRATFPTYTAPTAGAAYSQSQIQALMDAVQTLSRTTKALVDDLRAVNIISD